MGITQCLPAYGIRQTRQAVTEKSSHSLVSEAGIHIGSSQMQGWRYEMEDQHITSSMPSLPSHTLLAIFDGHGGKSSAIFAERKMIETIEQTNQWKRYLKSQECDINLLEEALIQAFVQIDEALRLYYSHNQIIDRSGCTAIAVLITPKYIVCASAGDCRCIIGSNGNVIPLSYDHKPYNALERKRIKQAGGRIQDDRIDGVLAVSRGFGDFKYKNKRMDPLDQKVTCYPDVIIHPRDDNLDELLVIGCDGLWDVLTNKEVYTLVNELLKKGEDNMMTICEHLIDKAFRTGSTDNITTIVVRLPGAVVHSNNVNTSDLTNE